MTSAVEDWAGGDSAVRELLDPALLEHAEGAVAHALATIASTTRRAVPCAAVRIRILGAQGDLEASVAVGDDGLAAVLDDHARNDPALAPITAGAGTVRLPPKREVPHLSAPDAPVPAMLGTSVLVRGQASGGIYLADPSLGAEFADADVRVLEIIATAVSNVVERARTATANRRREQWYASGTGLAREIVAGLHEDPLKEIVERVAAIAEADSVSIIEHGVENETLLVAAATGTAADAWSGMVLDLPGAVSSRVMTTGRPVNMPHVRDTALPPEWQQTLGIDAVLFVPLLGSGTQRGVIVAGRSTGRPAFTTAEVGMATMFAGTVGLALELSESQARRDQLALIDERDRIARDLHDHVIQRLYAIGLTVQNVSSGLPETAAQRLLGTVDDLDETIKQIRSTIFRLTLPIVSPETSLRGRAERLVDDLQDVLGFPARLVFNGPVDFGVADDVVEDCIAVLREALTNVARHANATAVEVLLSVSGTEIRLEVRDNGDGIEQTTRRSGLANMRSRALRRDGYLEIRSSAQTGTWLLWSIPLDGAA